MRDFGICGGCKKFSFRATDKQILGECKAFTAKLDKSEPVRSCSEYDFVRVNKPETNDEGKKKSTTRKRARKSAS